MMNITTFENAKVNDQIWSIEHRKWFYIAAIHVKYLVISDGNINTCCNFDGSKNSNKFQSYFWNEIEIIAPIKPKPKLKVDTKVIVWNNEDNISRKYHAYFSHFDNTGKIRTFIDGKTSWSNNNSYMPSWDFWELVKED